LGTPLNVISGRAGLIASGKLPAGDVSESATTIKQQAEHMTTIIRQLMEFARRSRPQRSKADLGKIVEQAAGLLSTLAEKRNVAMSWDRPTESCIANVDVGQIQQVLTNLIVNAVHAMPDGGRISIGVQIGQIRPPEDHEGAAGQSYSIVVRDEGVGMNEETMEHIFEPFFTTKDVGEGTGLGLSIAYGIIQEHGGWIDVSSEPGKGSCFAVYLPNEESSQPT
jgi:signal transduction histidine kinase